MEERQFPLKELQNPLSTEILRNSIPIDNYYLDIQSILSWMTSYWKNGNAERLIELYVKIGLFDEASLLLKDDDNRVADYYYYLNP